MALGSHSGVAGSLENGSSFPKSSSVGAGSVPWQSVGSEVAEVDEEEKDRIVEEQP